MATVRSFGTEALALCQSKCRKPNAQNVSFETLHSGQLILATQLIMFTKLPYLIWAMGQPPHTVTDYPWVVSALSQQDANKTILS